MSRINSYSYKNKKNAGTYGTSLLSSSIFKLTNPIFKKRGFTESRIISDWKNIVGNDIARVSSPARIGYRDKKTNLATLYVEVNNSSASMELTYMEPVIIEKISLYYGYKSIGKIKIIQKPVNISDTLDSDPFQYENKLSDTDKEKLDNFLEEIKDDELKSALSNLGKHFKVQD